LSCSVPLYWSTDIFISLSFIFLVWHVFMVTAINVFNSLMKGICDWIIGFCVCCV